MTENLLFIILLTAFTGTCFGWSVHVFWLVRRIKITPVRRYWPDGEITGYTLNMGKPVVGYFSSKDAAMKQKVRLVMAVAGRRSDKEVESGDRGTTP